MLLRLRKLEVITNSSISPADMLNQPDLEVAIKSVVPQVFKTIDIIVENVENIVLYVGTASLGDKEVPNANPGDVIKIKRFLEHNSQKRRDGVVTEKEETKMYALHIAAPPQVTAALEGHSVEYLPKAFENANAKEDNGGLKFVVYQKGAGIGSPASGGVSRSIRPTMILATRTNT